ncbi:MAG: ABC transporter [Candidatus Hydrogenedentes bacterium]|nr:ABC transporter [Candidatus Hydrogenedentota bacterium]
MKYRLVLQLPSSSIKDYNEVIRFESLIVEGIGELGEVDGHDAGSGEFNIFVLTDDPVLTFDRIKTLPGAVDFMPNLKVAFRELEKDEYVIIYPSRLSNFTLA